MRSCRLQIWLATAASSKAAVPMAARELASCGKRRAPPHPVAAAALIACTVFPATREGWQAGLTPEMAWPAAAVVRVTVNPTTKLQSSAPAAVSGGGSSTLFVYDVLGWSPSPAQ